MSVVSFAIIFSHSEGFLFTLLIALLAVLVRDTGEQTDELLVTASDFTPKTTPVLDVRD